MKITAKNVSDKLIFYSIVIGFFLTIAIVLIINIPTMADDAPGLYIAFTILGAMVMIIQSIHFLSKWLMLIGVALTQKSQR